MMYINSVADRLSTVTEITLFSDTCGGQNRNQYVAAGLLYSLRNTPKLQYINQKFLERGHSEMEVDSIHSTIETEKENESICPITVAHSGHHGAKAFSINHCSDQIHGCSQLQSSCARVLPKHES